MSFVGEIRLFFVVGLLLLGVFVVLLELGVARLVASWRGYRDRAATRVAGQSESRGIEAGVRDRRVLATQARWRLLL